MEQWDSLSMRLAFVGDVALGNHPKAPGFGFFARYQNGIPPEMSNRILPPGISTDLLFGNLEFALNSDTEQNDPDICCLGVASYLPFLRQAGFTVFNVANNHSWQHGAELFQGTVNLLKNSGIKVVGVPEDFDPAGFLRIKGRTIAFLGCSARPRQGFNETPDYNEFDKGSFFDKIHDARNKADLVCVSIHWGEEFLLIPHPDERTIAHAMIDAGAGVVVGHHPHVLREVESYNNGVIAYSLGNFIGDMLWNPLTRETGCMVVETDGSRIHSGLFFPASIDKDFFPRYLSETASQEFLKSQVQRHISLNQDLESFSYDRLARKALRQHQWLTIFFLMKNLFRYRVGTLGSILFHAICDRLQLKSE